MPAAHHRNAIYSNTTASRGPHPVEVSQEWRESLRFLAWDRSRCRIRYDRWNRGPGHFGDPHGLRQSSLVSGNMSTALLLPLGVGEAFTSLYYTSCFALGVDDHWLLIDCPHPVRKMLRE